MCLKSFFRHHLIGGHPTRDQHLHDFIGCQEDLLRSRLGLLDVARIGLLHDLDKVGEEVEDLLLAHNPNLQHQRIDQNTHQGLQDLNLHLFIGVKHACREGKAHFATHLLNQHILIDLRAIRRRLHQRNLFLFR